MRHLTILGVLLLTAVQAAISQGGLVAYYPFSGNASDATVNHNDGTPYGGVALSVDRFGNPNSAYSFNGNGFITVNNSFSLQIGSVWSIAFWFRADNYGPDIWMGMVTKAGPSVDYSAGPREMLLYDTLNRIPISFVSMGPPPYVYETPVPLELNRWYHCAMTSAGDSVRSYLNGTCRFTFPTNYSWTFSNSYPLTIGAQNGSFHNRYFNGSLDDVGIFNRALTVPEIQALYNNIHPQLEVQPSRLEFGRRDFPVDSLLYIKLTNTESSGLLNVDSISVSEAAFIVSPTAGQLPPNESLTITVRYAPAQPGKHSGIISIYSSDPLTPRFTIPVHGEAWEPLPAAQIISVEDVPRDSGRKVRLQWYHSVYDDNASATFATAYSVWKRAAASQPGGGISGIISGNLENLARTNTLWEFIAQIPAARFTEYAYVVNTDADSTAGKIPWIVLVVATTLSSGEVLLSEPDSGYSIYGPWPTALSVEGNSTPVSSRLYQNYPNPFNPTTTIIYELPNSSEVRLIVYDLLGREVSVLVNEREDAGAHEVKFDASRMSSGVYLYRLHAGDYVETRKLVVMR